MSLLRLCQRPALSIGAALGDEVSLVVGTDCFTGERLLCLRFERSSRCEVSRGLPLLQEGGMPLEEWVLLQDVLVVLALDESQVAGVAVWEEFCSYMRRPKPRRSLSSSPESLFELTGMVLVEELLRLRFGCHHVLRDRFRRDHPFGCGIEHPLAPAHSEVVALTQVMQAVLPTELAEPEDQLTRQAVARELAHVEDGVPLHDLTRKVHDAGEVFPKKRK